MSKAYVKRDLNVGKDYVPVPDVDLSDYYKKSEVYNKTEVDAKLPAKSVKRISLDSTEYTVDETEHKIVFDNLDITDKVTDAAKFNQGGLLGIMYFGDNGFVTAPIGNLVAIMGQTPPPERKKTLTLDGYVTIADTTAGSVALFILE